MPWVIGLNQSLRNSRTNTASDSETNGRSLEVEFEAETATEKTNQASHTSGRRRQIEIKVKRARHVELNRWAGKVIR